MDCSVGESGFNLYDGSSVVEHLQIPPLPCIIAIVSRRAVGKYLLRLDINHFK
jgi:hypothetical protein